jgi:hypothetical protein
VPRSMAQGKYDLSGRFVNALRDRGDDGILQQFWLHPMSQRRKSEQHNPMHID